MPADLRRAKDLFAAALDLPPADRAAFLDRECDGELRRRVDALLAAHDDPASALERPLVDSPTHSFAPESATADHVPTETPGMVVAGRYKLLESIGEGGMGEVWVADQLEPIKRRVALKLIKPGMDSRSVLARFEAERQALALMDHPNIAKVLDAGTTDDGRPYFVMELVKGTPITTFCDKRKLTPKERLELFIPVCQAIQHAHHKGIIHRDIKPSNVLVALHDEKPVPKVIDFGVAKAVGQQLTERTLYTGFGALVGTPAYMAPEQATFNQLDIDTRADVYALGVLLYELLAGSPPVEPERLRKAGLDEILRLVREEEPPRPSARLSTSQAKASIAAVRQSDPAKLSSLMRGELDWIVMKALEKDRTRRYDTPTTLAKDVERYLKGDAVEACPPTLAYRLRKAYRRNRNPIRVGVAFAALLVGGIVASTGLAVQARRAEQWAKVSAEKAKISANESEEFAKIAGQQTQTATRERDAATAARDLQQRTRYAAEMNLLQAAYNAKEMEQVKALLLAQTPKPGEPDYRGPEWHYWDRKLNGFVKEFTLPVKENVASRGSTLPTHMALSPDGRRFAEGWIVADEDEENPRKLFVRLWDTDTGQVVKSLDRDVIPVLQLTAQDRSVPRSVHVAFKNGGRDLLLQCSQPVYLTPGGETPGWVRDLAWNTETDETKLLYRAEVPVPENSARPGMAQSVYTDDLSARATSGHAPERRERFVEVVRLADQKVLFRKESKETTSIKMFADGRHLLTATLSGSPPGLGNPTRTSTETLWKLDGSETPLWTREVVIPSAGGPDGFRPSFRASRPSADGKSYTEYVTTRDGLTATRYDLETGKPAGSQLLLDKSDLNPRSLTPGFGNPVAVMATDAASRRLVTMSALGVAVRRWDEAFPAGAGPPPPDCEMLDGPPQLMGLRADGMLVTVHRSGRETKLRLWHLPTDADLARPVLPLSGGVVNRDRPYLSSIGSLFSRDRSRVAQVMFDGLPRPSGLLGADRPSPNPVRLMVVDSSGKKLLNVDCTKSETIVLPGGTNALNSATAYVRGLLGFSADGRYFHYVLRTRSQKTPPVPAEEFDEVVIRDLQTNTDAARVRLDAGHSIQSLVIPQGQNRFLIAFGPRPAVPDAEEEDSPRRPLSARLYEFPTGRLIGELKAPADKTLRSFSFDGENWFGNTGPITAEKTAPEAYWDVATGKYLGERVRSTTRPRAERPTGRVLRGEQAAGSRVVRTFAQREFANATSVEVWDAARVGADDKPLFTIEDSADLTAYLGPDGKRLLVHRLPSVLAAAPTASRLTLYCTETGRPVVSLPRVNSMSDTGTPRVAPLGFWSADGRQFWLAMNTDGTLSGYDFRPREEPKK